MRRTGSTAIASARRWPARPAALLGLGLVVAVAAFQLWITPSNPPGFIRDEASISYNAYRIAQDLHDENGALLPLYFPSFGDYKSPLFVYALAGALRVTGPQPQAPRTVAAVSILAAVLLLGLLARRRSGSTAVGLAIVVLGGATPWLFELGRVAYETVLEPLVVAALLVAVDAAVRTGRWTIGRAVPVGLALGALFYVYAAGRLLAPLFAGALLLLAGRGRWRFLAVAWGTFALTLLPAVVYWYRHPGALTARYQATTFIDDDMSLATIVRTAASNYVHDANLWHWVVSGDPKPYVHTVGAGMLLGSVVVLALAGIAIVLRGRRDDPFWPYAIALLVLAPIPAALTDDRFYALRLAPVPVLLLVLAVPALEAFYRARREWPVRGLAAALAVVAAVQLADFVDAYRTSGPRRTEVFEAGLRPLLARAFAGGRTIYVDRDDDYSLAHARWYAVSHGIPVDRVVRLADGGVPPPSSVVLGRYQGCDFECREFARADAYWLATGPGPP